MDEEIKYLRDKVKELKLENQLTKDTLEDKILLCKLFYENEGRLEEEIRLLKNQLHSSGKKPRIPKKPELDWNQKIRIIQDHVQEYEWRGAIEEIETLFDRRCLNRWKGVQKAYEKSGDVVSTSKIIEFPVGT